jgi:pimeloyl-ACP methyl ester carboxylesterase
MDDPVGSWHGRLEVVLGETPESLKKRTDVRQTEFRSLDGLRLAGTLVVPDAMSSAPAVLVHGGGVTRDEGGFFTRMAAALADAGIASLRFDMRAHGESDGDQRDLTLAGVVNDIRAATDHARATLKPGPVHLLGTSFGGGVSAFFAAAYPDAVATLVLMNPLLDYKRRIIDEKPYWSNDYISHDMGQELVRNGLVAHSPTFHLGRPLLNEVFYFRPQGVLQDIRAATLVVHGTRDTFISVDSSRRYVRDIRAESRLLEIEGAQHGFAVHDDPGYVQPQTQEWQAFVIRSIVEWIIGHQG